MYIAQRDGAEQWLIPDSYRWQYENAGYRCIDPPAGLRDVHEPVLLAETRPLDGQLQLSAPIAADVYPAAAAIGGDKMRPKRKRG